MTYPTFKNFLSLITEDFQIQVMHSEISLATYW